MGGSANKKADSYDDNKKSYQEPPSQGEMISSVIESNEGIRNDQELYDLVKQFFSHSISISAFCNEIESCVNKARDSRLKLHAAVQIFKEGRGDGANGRDKYKRSLEELEKFMNSKCPFIGLPEKLQKVPQQHHNKLKLNENKIKKKMVKTMIGRIAIAFIFMSLITSVISCQAYLDSTGLVLMVPKVGLVTAVKVSAIFSGWIVLQSVCKKYFDKLKRQQDLVDLMKNRGLIEIKNFDETKMAAEKVANLVLQLKENAKFTLEGEEKVKIGFEDIEKKMDKFAKSIENMAECVEKCSEDLKKGREEIITKIRAVYI